ncbi:MAG TPA: hypothetical protein VN495_04430 [Candidatus Paceibacterota bacterium]|nr:hypothetical protein [Candidatus Paceibacterota bacterium]
MALESGRATETQPQLDSRFDEFVEKREIQKSDFLFLEELAALPKRLVVENLHNHFNMYREGSAVELERLMQRTSVDDPKLRMYEIFLDLASRYDWTALYNLVRVLER